MSENIAESAEQKLGRFDHHPDPAIDFEIEVQSLEARLFDAKGGISKPGTDPEGVSAVLAAIERAMTFVVGGDSSAVAAKQTLRALEAEAKSALESLLPSIMGSLSLASDECLVALDECGTGWIIAQSQVLRDGDVLSECSADDCGFNHGWDKGLSVGVYLVTIRPWAHQSFEGEWDAGVDVIGIKPMWTVPSEVAA